MPVTANALPTKRFFIENLTRDLSLEDALLDLVDNSIDAFIRSNGIDVSPSLLTAPVATPQAVPGGELVRMTVTPDEIVVEDRCGGITRHHAIHNVFRMGRVDGEEESALGVYGIGLKRAVFKMGRDISIESRTPAEGFRVHIDVPHWAADDADWQLPMEFLNGARESEAGTIIRVRELNPEVLLRIQDGTLLTRLVDSLSATYTLFLERFLTISLNGTVVPPRPLPIGRSEELSTGKKELVYDNVQVEIFAGLAARYEDEWTTDRAGWYILCNGRVVVNADKSDLTGWGAIAPQYASKYRGFIGIAFFFSEDPAALPWTTTKRGLNRESPVFQLARKEMSLSARPVLTFLNNMYPSEPAEEVHERKMVDRLKPVSVTDLAAQPVAAFEVRQASKRERPTTISVQYRVEKSDVERIKTHLNQPSWSAGSVGKYTFDYFLRVECPE